MLVKKCRGFLLIFPRKIVTDKRKNNRELSGCQDGGRICGGEK